MFARTFACGLALLAAGAGFAQEPKPVVEEDIFTVAVPPPSSPHQEDIVFHRAGPAIATFDFVGAEMSIAGKVVKGAPYSAEAVTETIQTLADGNRIIRKSTAAMYRDSEGRTRREHTLPGIGPWASSGEPAQIVTIHDPVANMSYTLETRGKTARKFAVSGSPVAHAGVAVGVTGSHAQVAGPGPGFSYSFERKIGPAPASKQSKVESLGKRNIEGVLAEGTRNTITVPAGEIGNERPIEIVSERWYSPELQTVVMTRHRDPRMGETVYQMTRISRAEPHRSLFEVPPDYKVTEERIMSHKVFERKTGAK